MIISTWEFMNFLVLPSNLPQLGPMLLSWLPDQKATAHLCCCLFLLPFFPTSSSPFLSPPLPLPLLPPFTLLLFLLFVLSLHLLLVLLLPLLLFPFSPPFFPSLPTSSHSSFSSFTFSPLLFPLSAHLHLLPLLPLALSPPPHLYCPQSCLCSCTRKLHHTKTHLSPYCRYLLCPHNLDFSLFDRLFSTDISPDRPSYLLEHLMMLVCGIRSTR